MEFLHILFLGGSYKSLMYLFRIPQTTIARIIPECCDAIYDCLQAKYLKVGTQKLHVQLCIFIEKSKNKILITNYSIFASSFSSRENADRKECTYFLFHVFNASVANFGYFLEVLVSFSCILMYCNTTTIFYEYCFFLKYT
nr:unnamed protein product [Callosobruchus analis]